jgi:hypothetical protein
MNGPTITQLCTVKFEQTVPSFGGPSLRVSQRTWGIGTTIEAVNAGAVPSRVVATEDGRHVEGAWHTGPDSGDEVYFERYDLEDGTVRRVSHGWIDRVTRRLVQVG